MATRRQLIFISDCETAIKAIKSQGRTVSKIWEVLDAAGRNSSELSAMATRLANAGCYAEVKKLQSIFAEVGLNSESIDALLKSSFLESINLPGIASDQKPEPEPELEDHFALLRDMPDPLPPFIAAEETPTPTPTFAFTVPSQALSQVIQILTPLSNIYRERILHSAGLFLGVGV